MRDKVTIDDADGNDIILSREQVETAYARLHAPEPPEFQPGDFVLQKNNSLLGIGLVVPGHYQDERMRRVAFRRGPVDIYEYDLQAVPIAVLLHAHTVQKRRRSERS